MLFIKFLRFLLNFDFTDGAYQYSHPLFPKFTRAQVKYFNFHVQILHLEVHRRNDMTLVWGLEAYVQAGQAVHRNHALPG